jgi:hypothetical protein
MTLGIMTLGIVRLGIMTFGFMRLSIMTLGTLILVIMTFRIMTLSKRTLSLMPLNRMILSRTRLSIIILSRTPLSVMTLTISIFSTLAELKHSVEHFLLCCILKVNMLIVVWTICHGAIFKDFMRSQENYNLEILVKVQRSLNLATTIKLFIKFIKFIIPC